MQSQINLELIEQFINGARESTANIKRIPANADSLSKSLETVVGDELVLLAEPDDLDPELFSIYKLKKNVVTLPTNEQLLNITTGITDCFCGIASTGSVCVSNTRYLSGHSKWMHSLWHFRQH